MCKIRFQTPKNYFQILDLEVLFWTSLIPHLGQIISELTFFFHTHALTREISQFFSYELNVKVS